MKYEDFIEYCEFNGLEIGACFAFVGVEIDGSTYWKSNAILVWESKMGVTLEIAAEFDVRAIRDKDGEIFRGRLEKILPEQYLEEIPDQAATSFFAISHMLITGMAFDRIVI